MGWRCGAGYLGVVFVVLSSLSVQAEPGHSESTDQLIIKLKPQPSSSAQRVMPSEVLERLQQARDINGNIVRTMGNGAHVVKLARDHSRQEMQDLQALLSQYDDIEYAEPDHRVVPAADPYYSYQWYILNTSTGINAGMVRDYSDGSGVVVGVLDTGVLPHEDLIDSVIPGYDLIGDLFTANDGDGRDADPSDPGDGVLAGECGGGNPTENRKSTWHGTNVSALIAAPADNGVGIHGLAPGAQIQPIRVLGRCGGYTSDIADGIMWGAGYPLAGVPSNPTPASILNLSLSTSSPTECSQTYMDAIGAALDAGVLVVAAAGNDSGNADEHAPANCPGVITVAATDRQGNRAEYSNVGSVVDLAAPGGTLEYVGDFNGIWTASSSGEYAPGVDTYVSKQGTSLSTPMVSATLALMKSAKPEATAQELKQDLLNTTHDFPGACTGCGSGMLDVDEAVRRVLGLTVENGVADLGVVLKGNNGKFVEDPDNPDEGTIQYKAEVTNYGPDGTYDVSVGFVFPEQATLEQLSSDVYTLCNIDTIVCKQVNLVSGQKATFYVTVRTSNRNKMDFSVSAYGPDTDPNLDNNYATGRFGGAFLYEILMLISLFAVRKFFRKS